MLGFRVLGLGFRVLGFRIWGLGVADFVAHPIVRIAFFNHSTAP